MTEVTEAKILKQSSMWIVSGNMHDALKCCSPVAISNRYDSYAWNSPWHGYTHQKTKRTCVV